MEIISFKWKVFCILLLLSYGCRGRVQDPDHHKEKEEVNINKTFIDVNKYLLKRHQDQITSFVNRMGWEMEISGTGLWYEVYRAGEGRPAEKGNIVDLNFTISLLDGTVCDSSGGQSPKSFRIGHGGVEAGLEEGVLLLREGDKARFIMPPHLAHGNFGDREKIPPGAILIYDVEIINIR